MRSGRIPYNVPVRRSGQSQVRLIEASALSTIHFGTSATITRIGGYDMMELDRSISNPPLL